MSIAILPLVQTAEAALLVRPAHFGFNADTAASNRFQQPAAIRDAAARARDEFDALCAGLSAAGVRLCVAEDSDRPLKPDAVFPNNWVSFHRDGSIVLYPMQAVSRRAERRLEILQQVESQLGFRRTALIDLSGFESQQRYLEGTGSLVLDHVQRVAYACRSPRTDAQLVRDWARRLDYEAIVFDAHGSDGTALYHTNVLMSIGSGFSAICSAALAPADRQRVLEALQASGRRLIDLSQACMQAFAGNMLELAGFGRSGRRRVLALSQSAADALQRQQPRDWLGLLDTVDELVIGAIPTIEQLGGGSIRCMLAEVPCRP